MKSTQTVLETKNLTKIYNGTPVVNNLNLEIGEGEIFGFLGPNGAGKTTTILMILGLTEPTSGEVKVFGYNSTREPLPVKRITSYLPENVGFYEDLTALENLTYITRLNHIPEKEANERIDEVLSLVGLAEVSEMEVGKFSKGMKQRLGLATVFVKKPKLAILDEPTTGIDPQGVEEILELITEVNRKENITFFVCSHLLYQVQKICSKIGIFSKGKMVAMGSLEEISKKILPEKSNRLEISIADSQDTDELIKNIQKLEGVLKVEKRTEEISLEKIYTKYFQEDI
ncbi:MAG: ABC transporter ATP-binding protein [Candidatus Atribacteria bacterium]|nr:ABC transporter ATP-binding protein [Candidatus Atribacteria bacterium]